MDQGIDLRGVRRQFEAAWKERRARSERGVAMLQKLVREFQTLILGATDKKARLKLILHPQITARSTQDVPKFILRGTLCMFVAEYQINIVELGDIEHMTPVQCEKVRFHLAKYLMEDSVIHGLLGFAVTKEYGCKERNTQEIMAKLMEHQLREYERSEQWRGVDEDEESGI